MACAMNTNVALFVAVLVETFAISMLVYNRIERAEVIEVIENVQPQQHLMRHPSFEEELKSMQVDRYVPAHLQPIPAFRHREDLAEILEMEKKEIGVELGVRFGHFAKSMLTGWTSCQKYVLVDIWGSEKGNQTFASALSSLSPWRHKLQVCRNLTVMCSNRYPDEFFDFVYVDAGHDRQSTLQDLTKWWPKLKPGGIMAGHDYVTTRDVGGYGKPARVWMLNVDGTSDLSGRITKGAIDDFFLQEEHVRQMSISYAEPMGFPSFAVRK